VTVSSSYRRLCSRVASAIGASPCGSDLEIERNIVAVVATHLDDALLAERKLSFEELLAKYDRQHETKLLQVFAAGGVVALFRAGEFGSYLAATNILSSVAGGFGITLPFGVYVGVSSMLSIAAGPIGWSVLGLSAFKTIQEANDVRLLPIVLWAHIVMLRLQLRGSDGA
jgi:uncharacterized protein YaaW (UPF0174 family)